MACILANTQDVNRGACNTTVLCFRKRILDGLHMRTLTQVPQLPEERHQEDREECRPHCRQTEMELDSLRL